MVQISSHFLHEIETLCNRIAILHNHKIVEMGSLEDLKNIYSKNFEVHLKTKKMQYSRLLKQLARHKKLYSTVFVKDRELIISTPAPTDIVSILLDYVKKNNYEINSLNVARPSLGTVFEVLIKK